MPIGFHHEVAIGAGLRLAEKLFNWNDRLVRRGVGQIKKERLSLAGCFRFALHPFDRFRGKPIKAFHVDKVGSHLEPLRLKIHLPSTGFLRVGRLLGGLLVRRHNAVILNRYLARFLGGVERGRHLGISSLEPSKHAVVHGSGYAPEIIEPFVQGHILDRLRPVTLPLSAGKIHSEMPLAHHRRMVPIVTEKGGKRDATILDQAFLLGPEHPSLQSGAPGIPARE